MQREYELIDVIVAVGVCATIVAGGMFFLAADGAISVTRSGAQTSELTVAQADGMQWLQPVLGLAIVDQVLLDRRHAKNISAVGAHLHGLRDERSRWQNSPFGYLESIKTSAGRAEADHAAGVQAVMGRSIVNATARGVRSGVLSPDGAGADYNARLTGVASAQGRRMDASFVADWQPNLGRAIVSASQNDTKVSALRQERLGAAIVRLSAAHAAYDASRAAIQEQLGGAAVVATRTESDAMLLPQGPPVQSAAATAAVRLRWPVLPLSTMIVASIILLSLFAAGLLLSPALPAPTWARGELPRSS
jgi:hypothetical protein